MSYIIKKVIKDCVTGKDNSTYDPLKVIGYPCVIAAFIVYLLAAISTVYKHGSLDYIAYGTGFTALMAGLLAIAAGVAVKSHTEPT